MRFSIVIPSYKGKYLAEAIDSCLQQNYSDYELIIVDDNSPDDLESIVRGFQSDKIKYIKNVSNIGAEKLVNNWNNCLKYCQGDYIINMGDDDRLLPCCLLEFERLILKYPELNVYHAKTQIIDEDGRVYTFQDSRPERESVYSMIFRQWNYNKYQFIGDFCFSRKWLTNNRGYIYFPYALNSDGATANLAALKKGIANSNVSMFQYRQNRYTISNTQDLRIGVKTLVLIYRFYLNILKEKADNEEDELIRDVLLRQCYPFFRNRTISYIKRDIRFRFNLFECYCYWSKHTNCFNVNKLLVFKIIVKRIFRL